MMYGWGSGIFSFPWGVMAAVFTLWSLFWKGVALWKAARSGENYWFIGLLLINTFGLLEILYIFFFTKGPKGLPQMNSFLSATRSAPARRGRAKKSK